MKKGDYKYNIRGWLTDINNISGLAQSGAPQDLFAFKINYTSVTNTVNGNVKPLYNGNIAETEWRTASDNLRRKYGYTYDHQNRLTDAWYSIPNTAVSNSYNEHLSYDSNGNILTLQRYGEVEDAEMTMMIDDLVYGYDLGNKLINVTDAEHHPAGFNDGNIHTESSEDDFEYDAYGNLIVDRNKGIDLIEYNHLNLPKRVSFGDMGEITYLYDANGIKLKKTVNDYQASLETDTHYLDGFQYTGDHLDFFPHAEGYVNVLDYSEFNYVYTYKDHLGNIRLRYTLNPQTDKLAILEEDHYYPFGLKHQGYNNEHEMFQIENSKVVLVPVTNPFGEEKFRYKFNGMEHQSELGLEMYDFGFRNYDPALGRWMNIDPLAELMRRHSPYNFAFNNPMRFIDPDGMAPFDTTEEEEEEFDWEEFIKNLAADFINSDSEENVLTITFSDNDSNNADDGDGGGCPEGVDCNERRLAPKRDFDSMDSSGYNSKYGLVDCECEGTMYQGVPGDGLIGIGNPFQIFQGVRALFAARASTASWGKVFYYRHGGQMSAIEHIMYRHSYNTGFSNVSRFSRGTDARMIKEYVDQAVKHGTPIKGGFEYNFGKVIGTGANGAPASSIRVYVRDGWVRTAFPF